MNADNTRKDFDFESKPQNNCTLDCKQMFLSNAISDISGYIQLSDTKVSIIMGALTALIGGIFTVYEPIGDAINGMNMCKWNGVLFVITSSLILISIVCTFVFGIQTIRGHKSDIKYASKWFIKDKCKKYSFDEYKHDVQIMTDEDVVDNMIAELYKLNDIHRQKSWAVQGTIYSFSVVLTMLLLCIVLILK